MVLFAVVVVIGLGPAQVWANPVAVQVDYHTAYGQSCVRSFCFPITPGATFAKTFTIGSAQLAADGSYDVSATLAPEFVIAPGTTSSAMSVQAVVAGGTVTDLLIHFDASGSVTIPIIGTTYSSQTFDASGGTWSSSSSSSSSLSYGSGSGGGTYIVTMVPEAASLALAGLGLALLALRARRGVAHPGLRPW